MSPLSGSNFKLKSAFLHPKALLIGYRTALHHTPSAWKLCSSNLENTLRKASARYF